MSLPQKKHIVHHCITFFLFFFIFLLMFQLSIWRIAFGAIHFFNFLNILLVYCSQCPSLNCFYFFYFLNHFYHEWHSLHSNFYSFLENMTWKVNYIIAIYAIMMYVFCVGIKNNSSPFVYDFFVDCPQS